MASTAINNRADTANTGGEWGNNSLQQSVNLNWGDTGYSSGVRGNIVSPPDVDSDEAREQCEGVVCALFNQELNLHDIPSQHICLLTQEPPVVGVYFDVPDINGDVTDQVFEQSQLYRWIATPGNMRMRQNVSHPINQQFVPRPSAWNLVRAVSTDLQAVLTRERQALNLVLVDENPLTADDIVHYKDTMRALADRFVPFINMF
jgi:hypothetical protein